MRTVVKSEEVAHFWANQTQVHARNARDSLSFEGVTLYSYRATIGRLLKHKRQTVAVLTTRTWSVTTSGHQRDARSATRHLKQVFVPGDIEYTPKEQRRNFDRLVTDALRNAATKTHPASRKKAERELAELIGTANAYCEAFGLKPFTLPTNLDDALAAVRRADARKAKAEEKRLSLLRAEAFAKAERWKVGNEAVLGYYERQAVGHDLMRLIDGEDGQEIQTTQGALVPADHVRRVAPFVLACLREGREWAANGESLRVGVFKVDRVTADGTVRAGCHTFPREEVERVAALLGVPNE